MSVELIPVSKEKWVKKYRILAETAKQKVARFSASLPESLAGGDISAAWKY